MTDVFLSRICEYADKLDMLPHSGTVLAAVSGGCDSMCLLHVLVMLSEKYGFDVEAVHFNHNLRGDESDGDEKFVADHCAALGIPCHIGSGDVNAEAARLKRSIEETARIMRYAFFDEIAAGRGDCLIATAHSANDNAETMLINLARGAGTAGLRGIPPKRGNIIRPLLCVTRDEIEQFLNENNIPHVEDSSNAGDDYTRNKLRHHVVPQLNEINPAFVKSAFQTAELLAQDDEYLISLAEDFISANLKDNALPAKKLADLPYPIAGRVIKKLIPGLSKRHVDSVLDLCRADDPSAEVMLPKTSVRRRYDSLVIGKAQTDDTFAPFVINDGDEVIIKEAKLKITCKKSVFDGNIHNSFNTFVLKCDNIRGAVTVRPRKTGDSISLIHRNGTKTLKKLFIDGRIPAEKRGLIPVIADDIGTLAVYGFGTDERNKVSFGDSVLNIKIEEII